MTRNQLLDTHWQHVNTQMIKNEDSLRTKWFKKNRNKLLDDLDQKHNGKLVQNKLNKLREQKELIEDDLPEEKFKEEPPPAVIKLDPDVNLEFMMPIEPFVRRILYEKNKESHEARKNYLQERYKQKPEEKFYFAECSNWKYGWNLEKFPTLPTVSVGRRLLIMDSFYRRNLSSVHPDKHITRTPQALYPKNYD